MKIKKIALLITLINSLSIFAADEFTPMMVGSSHASYSKFDDAEKRPEAILPENVANSIKGYLNQAKIEEIQKFFNINKKNINLKTKDGLQFIDIALQALKKEMSPEKINVIAKLIIDNKDNIDKDQVIRYIRFLKEAKAKIYDNMTIYGSKENKKIEAFKQIYLKDKELMKAIEEAFSSFTKLNLIDEKELKEIGAESEGCVIA